MRPGRVPLHASARRANINRVDVIELLTAGVHISCLTQGGFLDNRVLMKTERDFVVS